MPRERREVVTIDTPFNRLLIATMLASILISGARTTAQAETETTDSFDPERSELVAGLAELQQGLRKSNADSFGGLWIDASDQVHVALVGESPAIVQLVGDADLGASVVFHRVDASEAALDTAMAELSNALVNDSKLEGLEYAYLAESIQDNSIIIKYRSVTEEQVATVRARFGEFVTFEPSTESMQPVACSRTACPNPLKAGLQLYLGNWSTACMSAFVMRDWVGPVNYFLTSAGHCWNSSWTSR